MKKLYLDNDWEYVWPGVRRNTDTGETEPAAGLANLTAWISATDGGNTIDATLQKTMNERASTAGQYYNIVDGDVLRTHLLSLVGMIVWEVFGDGLNVKYSAPRRVVERRRP